MADNTKIEWTDSTWNVITGCSVVSAGCRHCYAMKLAGTRLQHHPSRAGLTVETAAGPVWNGVVRFNDQWMRQPFEWKRPRRIFVCAHGDLFHESVPDRWIDIVFAVMALSPQHTFQVLTKRPERMLRYFTHHFTRSKLSRVAAEFSGRSDSEGGGDIRVSDGPFPLPNVWLGVSVEDQAAADTRIPLLLQTPAAVRWISAEPLLGPVDLRLWLGIDRRSPDAPFECGGFNQGIDWVVVGGESGPKARPMHPDWVRSLRDQCAAADVAFLMKQWGEWAPNWNNDDDGNKIPGSEWMDRFGKKAAGRLLDGVLHDGYPEARP